MQESYSSIFMASGLFAYLGQGQNTWAPDFQSYRRDADEEMIKQLPEQGPEAATWFNSYRCPVSIHSSDPSDPDDEPMSEEEDENLKRVEGPRVTKPQASLLGKPNVGSKEGETWESGNNHLQGHTASNNPAAEKDGDLVGNENIQQGIDAEEGSQNVCLKCGKKYGRTSTLKRHAKSHSSTRPYICATCGKGFIEKSKLIAHTQAHNKKLHLIREPYECPECGEDFFTKASFNKHRATHTNEPTYSCPDCGKSYKAEMRLVRHVAKAHSGATLFKCPDCGKGFTKEKALTRHRVTFHTEGGSFYRRHNYRPRVGEESPPIKRRRKLPAMERPCRLSECKGGLGDDAGHWRMQEKGKPHKSLPREMHFGKRPPRPTNRERGAEEYSHECPVCGRCFKNGRCFANHWRVHERQRQREQAGAFGEETRLTRNKKTQVDFESDACFDCRKPLCADSTLPVRPEIEMEGNLYKCPNSRKIFRDSRRFAKRQRRGHQEDLEAGALPADQLETPRKKGSYRCSRCERVYSTHSNLRRHQRVHSGCRPAKRPSGGEGFACAGSFPDNQKACVKGGSGLHKCSCCAKGFRAKSVLKGRLPPRVKVKPYKCPICGKAFASRYTLAQHLETHEDEQHSLHICSFCSKAFRTWTSLNRHQQLHMGEKRYQCTVCGKAFAYRDALAHHREIHTQGQFHKCNFCLKTFPTGNSLSRHRLIHLKTRSYQCSICQKAFGTKYSLRRHQDTHGNGSPGKLTGGGEGPGVAEEEASTTEENSNGSPDGSMISGHEDIDKEKESFESVGGAAWDSRSGGNSAKGLEEYKNTFGDGSVLPEYQARHADESVSPLCENSINSKHQGVHVEGNSPECSGTMGRSELTGQEEPVTGDRTLSRDGSVVAHNPASDTEGHFSLWTDNSAYSGLVQGASIGEKPSGSVMTLVDGSLLAEEQSTHLEEHPVNGLDGQDPVGVNSTHLSREGVVTGKERHTCLNCGKSCRDKYSLTRHQVTHTSAGSYQCQTCERSFRKPQMLARHQLTHGDLKPNQCHECGKCFKTRSCVDRHLKTHREKPYCCVYCDKRVATGTNLRNHLRLHTGERPYKCAECDKDYTTLWTLKNHLKTHLKTSSA
ncbi:zinc finger protein 11-like [Zootoca vivipara]|uniref:zinc finger protein 11-like n=1 Tax=Zootoca vivipara TaxID=8524 RepID=UPI00293B8BD4|nr:zinc finger protein 11-like [Zootoca vivipara]